MTCANPAQWGPDAKVGRFPGSNACSQLEVSQKGLVSRQGWAEQSRHYSDLSRNRRHCLAIIFRSNLLRDSINAQDAPEEY